MPVTEAAVLDALRAVNDPDLHKDIVTLGFVKNLRITDASVAFVVELTTPACPVKDLLRDQARSVVLALPGVSRVDVEMTAQVRAVGRPELGRGRSGRYSATRSGSVQLLGPPASSASWSGRS